MLGPGFRISSTPELLLVWEQTIMNHDQSHDNSLIWGLFCFQYRFPI